MAVRLVPQKKVDREWKGRERERRKIEGEKGRGKEWNGCKEGGWEIE